MTKKQITWKLIFAATLEYLSVLPTNKIFFEIFPLDSWFPPGQNTRTAKVVDFFRNQRALIIPLFLRKILHKINSEYDVELKAWPKSVKDFPNQQHVKKKLKDYIKNKKYLDAYAYFWSSRRPKTTKRLFIPLLQILNVKKRPVLATMGVFFWSGFLHACFAPLFILYLWLLPVKTAVITFFTIWLVFTAFGIPVAYRELQIYTKKNGRK